MAISRRNFMKAGIMGSICAAVTVTLTKGVHARSPAIIQSAVSGISIADRKCDAPFISCTKSTFSQYVNTKFLVYRKTGAQEEVTLVKVSDLATLSGKESATMGRAESFSLMFSGSARNPLEQDTYTIKHHDLGVFDLFLVAVGMPASKQNYQVIFNR